MNELEALFNPLDRTARQNEGKQIWLKSGGRGTFEYPTGFGKTRTAMNCITTVIAKYPKTRIIVVVPTTALRNQWTSLLDKVGLSLNCEVLVINTAIKSERQCDILVLDEIHRTPANTFKDVFTKIKYKFILGLTGTFDRLDGKHELIKKYCPVIDSITPEEAMRNGWVSQYKEYEVIIDVDDIDKYKEYNKEFTAHFEFFNYDFDLAMKMVGKNGLKNRMNYTNEICQNESKEKWKEVFKSVTYHSMQLMKAIQDRKAFINNHPKKLELTRKIIEAREGKKIITFSNNIKMAEAIGVGEVYSGKDSEKKGRATIDSLISGETMILNTIQKANEGLDIPGLSVAIILGLDSSKIKSKQRKGRVIRKEEDKQAEIFNIVINQTVELEWFSKSHEKSSYIKIDEKGLDNVLNGLEPDPYEKPIPKLSYRF